MLGPAFGPSGLLDFILRALRALRPCDPRNVALDSGKPNQPKNLHVSMMPVSTMRVSMMHVSTMHVSTMHVSTMHVSTMHVSMIHVSMQQKVFFFFISFFLISLGISSTSDNLLLLLFVGTVVYHTICLSLSISPASCSSFFDSARSSS